MLSAIVDTHAAIWYLFGDPRLSLVARTFIETAATEGDRIGLSTITLAEVVYLAEKERIATATFDRFLAALEMPGAVLIEVPFDRHVAGALSRVDRRQVPDLPDRIIAATALYCGVPIITRDAQIQTSGLATIW